MNMKRLIAVALCVLMLVSLTACTQKPHDHSAPSRGESVFTPNAEDATGSIFIGTWTVSAKKSVIDRITFNKNGTIQVFFDTYQLGGVFFDKDSTLSLYVSQTLTEGTYTVDGDVITVVTEDDVLVMKKV